MDTPPQSLHRDFCRPWLQKSEPPQSLQADLRRPWAQNEALPQSLHCNLTRPWLQMSVPWQSLQRVLRRPCMQMDGGLIWLTLESLTAPQGLKLPLLRTRLFSSALVATKVFRTAGDT